MQCDVSEREAKCDGIQKTPEGVAHPIYRGLRQCLHRLFRPVLKRFLILKCSSYGVISCLAFGADHLSHQLGRGDFGCAPIFFHHSGDDVGVDFSKDKGGVILVHEFTLLDGPDRDGPAAEHSWKSQMCVLRLTCSSSLSKETKRLIDEVIKKSRLPSLLS